MKRLLFLILFLSASLYGMGQSLGKVSLTIGIGMAYTPNYAIQGFLASNGVPRMDNWLFEQGGGVNFERRKLILGLDFYAGTGQLKDGLRGNRQRINSVQLSGYYQVWKRKDFIVHAGLRFGYFEQGAVLNVNPDTVNFNGNAFNSRGVLSLYNNQLSLGPSLRFSLMKSSLFALVSYDFSLYSSPWEVMGAHSENAPQEQNHFLRIGIAVPIMGYDLPDKKK